MLLSLIESMNIAFRSVYFFTIVSTVVCSNSLCAFIRCLPSIRYSFFLYSPMTIGGKIAPAFMAWLY